MIFKYFHIAFLYLLMHNLSAQQVNLSIPGDSITIGDQFEIFVQSSASQDSFYWLKEMHFFDQFEIIEYGDFQLRGDADDQGFEQKLNVQAWEEGMQWLPPMKYMIGSDSLETDSLLIPVYPFPIDTSNISLRPDKGLLDAPFEWAELKQYWWLIPIFLILIAAYFIWRYLQKKKQQETPEIIIPAHEWAFSQLGFLKGENLPEKAEYKEFYSRLSYILRSYIERRFEIHALERTTKEILQSGIQDEIDETQYAVLKQGLERADRVKYAKFTPDASIHDRAWQSIWNFIDLTKQKSIDHE